MKRLIALLLCMNILLSIVPVGAFAGEIGETVPEETVFAAETEAAETAAPEETAESSATEETAEPTVADVTVPEETVEETLPETTAAPEETVPQETAFPEATQEPALEEIPQEQFRAGEVLVWSCEEELPSEEEYFAAYAESQFYGSNATFGIAAGRTLDEGHKRIYDALAPEFHKIASGQQSSAVIPVGEYLADSLTVSVSGKSVTLPCNPKEEVNIRNLNINLNALLSAILADFPYELYWFDKTVGVSAIPITDDDGKTCVTFYFSICSQYRLNKASGKKYNLADYELKTAQTSAASAAAANARAIVAEYEALPDYEKLLAYKERICQLVDYNHSAASSSSTKYGDPWQMIWVFDGKESTKVVCEGYSKAFQYLCDLSEFENDIVCYSVTGYLNWSSSSPGDHMWNIVTVNDHGYLTDVTNCDTGFNLFMRGGTARDGVYTIAGQTYSYRKETENLWGTGEDSILTLTSSDLDPSNLPQKQNPADPESGDAWNGKMLLEMLEGASDRFHLSNNVVIDTRVILPEDVTLEIFAPYTVTVAEGGELIVPGTMTVGAGGVLRVKEGGILTNSGEILAAENAMIVNNGTVTNNGVIKSYISITGTGTLEGAPVAAYMRLSQMQTLLNYGGDVFLDKNLLLDDSVIIPKGTDLILETGVSMVVADGGTLSVQGNLILSHADASVQICSGAELINCGRIEVRNGTLEAGGRYVCGEGKVMLLYTCDAEGKTAHGTVRRVRPECLTVLAETASEDAVIREAMEYVRGLSGEVSEFVLRFVGNTVLSSDLELPDYSDTEIAEGACVTVPEGRKLTDHSGMAVYGKLILLGQAEATGRPIMAADSTCLEGAENCKGYYFDNLPLEEILVTADATTVLAHETVGLVMESWAPVGAKYFGHYRVDMEPSDAVRWTVGDDGTLLFSSNGDPCTVTVTVSATDERGTVLKNAAGEPIAQKLSLRFVAEQVSLYTQETKPDFYEADGTWGLYPGSSLHFYANMTGRSKYADETILWSPIEISEEFATVSLEKGILTVTAAESLTTTEEISFTVSDPSGVSQPRSYRLSLRPRAQQADVALMEETCTVVTGEKILYDLNRREEDTLTLVPLTDPEAAYAAGGFRADGKPMVSWKSSNTGIATVQDGIVTFTGKKTGSVKITMTANFGSKRDVTAAVTFNVVQLPQKIVPAENYAAALTGGSSATYVAYDVQNPEKALKSSAVRWYLCDEAGNPVDCHPYAAVSESGKLTTKAVADEDAVWLMAQVVGDEQSACLEEPLKVSLYPAITSLQILDETGKAVQNETLLLSDKAEPKLTWSADPEGTPCRSAAWKTSSKSVAAISEDGVITVNKPGTAKFTLTVTALDGRKTTASVTVRFGVFTGDIALSVLLPGEEEPTEIPEDLILESGEAVTFYGTNMPEEGEDRPVTTSGITWSVDNKTYATISSKGVLKAKTVYNPAEVTVFVRSKDGSVEKEIPVKIQPRNDAVTIHDGTDFVTKSTVVLEMGGSLTLEASEDVTWTSGKESVATVDRNGNVTPIKKGTATITAKTADKRSATVTVKVLAPKADMTIGTKKNADFAVASGKSLDLMATVRFEDGSKSTKVTWKIEETDAPATISSSGRLTANKGIIVPREITVTATANEGGWTRSQKVWLRPLTTGVEIHGPFGKNGAADISNTTQTWDRNVSDTFRLRAETFPGGTMGVNWSSSGTKIAVVDPEGNVTCRGSGTVTITATAKDGSGKKASFKLTVYKTMTAGSLQLPDTAFVGGGKSLTMTKLDGYAIDPEATNKTLSWTLTYPDGRAVPSAVATLSGGVLKTKGVSEPVELLITAAATDGSGERARCTVTIYRAAAGVKLYDENENALSKTVSLPLNGALHILPDTTNVKAYGTDDDKTADEYLPDGEAWTVTLSKKIARVEFDGQRMLVCADGAKEGQSVKITLKAADGSGRSAYVTVKFTAAQPE